MTMQHDPDTVLEPDAIFETAPRFVTRGRFRVRPANRNGLGAALLLGVAVEHPQHPGERVPRIIWQPAKAG
jgi:hypothetical protein